MWGITGDANDKCDEGSRMEVKEKGEGRVVEYILKWWEWDIFSPEIYSVRFLRCVYPSPDDLGFDW